MGAVADIGFGQLAVQPALLFSQKGERLVYSEDGYRAKSLKLDLRSRYNWLALPLTLVYAPRRVPGLLLLAGPYVALAVGGYQRGTTFDYLGTTLSSLDGPVSYGNDSYHRRFDAGLNLGLGYGRGPVQVQLTYGLGLLNTRQAQPQLRSICGGIHDFRADVARNRVAQLTGTYFFSL